MLTQGFMVAGLVLGLGNMAQASGLAPAVNSDLGCTASGQTVQYNGTVMSCGAIMRVVTTVGVLPVCTTSLRGTMYMVTDALAPVAMATVAAGGAIVTGVMCNGTNWIVQ